MRNKANIYIYNNIIRLRDFYPGKLFRALIVSVIAFSLTFQPSVFYLAEKHAYAQKPAASAPGLSDTGTFQVFNELTLPGMKKGKSFKGADRITLLLIRDLHCQKEAQLRIAKAIRLLRKKTGISSVFLEGAEGKLRTVLFESFPDARIRRDVGKRFLEEGFLTGAEYAAIEMGIKENLSLYGVEDTSLYLKNLKAFRNTRQIFAALQQITDSIDVWIEQSKNRLFSEEMKTLDKIRSMLDGEGMDLKKALMDLFALLNWQKSELSDAGDENRILVDALQMYSFSESLDVDLAEAELKKLVSVLEKNLVAEDLKMLAKKAIQYRLGQIRASEYLKSLKDLYFENDIRPEPFSAVYPNLEQWLMLTVKQENLDIESVWKRLEAVVEQTRRSFSQKEGLTDLVFLDDQWRSVKKLIQLQLTRKDLSRLESARAGDFNRRYFYSNEKSERQMERDSGCACLEQFFR